MSESRTIVVTGATRGLGRAMTDGFIDEGHIVLGCGRSLNAIKSLESTYGKPHRFDCVDVADDAQVAGWCQSLVADYGPPDLIVNNAATINRSAPLWELNAAEFDAVVDINVKGIANVLRHLLPAMVERERGIVVNFSSGWGRSTSPEVAPYCATKFAVEGLRWPTNSRTAWPPCHSIQASSTPTCCKAASVHPPTITQPPTNGLDLPCRTFSGSARRTTGDR